MGQVIPFDGLRYPKKETSEFNPDSPQSRGLVACYPLWEGGGDIVRNIVSNQFHCDVVNNSLSWKAVQQRGNTPDFSASEALRTAVGNFPLSITGYPFTLAGWMFRDTNADFQTIVDLGGSGSTSINQAIGVDQSGGNDFPYLFSRSGGDIFAPDNVTIAQYMWHLIIGVFASANSRTLYVNGKFRFTNTTNVGFGTTDRIGIGCLVDSSISSFSQSPLKHICIWNRALPAGEALRLYLPQSRWDVIRPKHSAIGKSITVGGIQPTNEYYNRLLAS